MRALARCRQRHSEIDIKVRIVGDGPLKDKLQEMIRDLGLQESVQLSGSLPRERIKAPCSRRSCNVTCRNDFNR